MIIERLDVYRVKVPLAFVWKTSYGDQLHTDTILVRMEGGGTCVTFGVSATSEVTFDARNFFVAGRTTLYGFYLFTELGEQPAGIGLRHLANLIAAGQLTPHISVERPWKEIAQVAQDLMARRYPGKAVLNLD